MKYALLTGASSGLGYELAPRLAKSGYALGLIGRNEQALSKLIEQLPPPFKKESKVILADLGIIDQVIAVKSQWEKPVDLLVNCAGVACTGLIEDIPLNEFERCWNVNFLSPLSLIQQVLPEMKQRRSGHIVNVSSGVARRALPFNSAYCSAKAALNSLTDSLRVELVGTGIDLLLFSPGPVDTRFHENSVHYGERIRHKPPFHGKHPGWVAEKLMLAISQKKKRVVLGSKAKLANHLQYWNPSLTDHLIARAYRLNQDA